jgi:transposase
VFIIFFAIKQIVHKEFVLAGQAVNSAYLCDFLRQLRENMRRLRPELWRQNNWLFQHDNAPYHTSFFTKEFWTKNNMTIVLQPSYFSSFSPIEYKTEGAPL